MNRHIAGMLLALGLSAGIANQAGAEYQEIDAIAAIVEEDVILASELVERLRLVQEQIQASGTQMPPQDILVSQIMERLIVENLQLQEAERRGVTVDDETLTKAVGEFAANNNMTIEQFAQRLMADGRNYIEFREQIRKEIMMQRLQRGIVNRAISCCRYKKDPTMTRSPVPRRRRISSSLNFGRARILPRWRSRIRRDRERSRVVIWAGERLRRCRVCLPSRWLRSKLEK
jgi:hypothetical protein